MTRHRRRRPLLALALLALGLLGCAPASGPLTGGPWPQELAAWDLLQVQSGALAASAGSVVYDLASPLFSDHTGKYRTLRLPAGASATVAADGKLQFPVGTTLSKTFYWLRDGALDRPADGAAVPEGGLDLAAVRLLETRILAHGPDGWQAASYVWQPDGGATLALAGDLLPGQLVLAEGEAATALPYLVPDANQCAGCHVLNDASGELEPIGPHLANLRHGVAAMAEQGWLPDPLPAVDPWPAWDDPAAPLAGRARAYLAANCGHCHRPGGVADTSGLYLDAGATDATSLGLCKPPVAAGRGAGGLQYGVVPGAPEASILVHRMAATDPGSMMPELGRALPHADGLALVRAWIAAMPGGCS